MEARTPPATYPASPVLDAIEQAHARAMQPRALSRKVKELLALAASVAADSEAAVAYHLHNALEAGATPAEVIEAVEVTVVVLGEPGAIHGARILRALDPGAEAPPPAAHPYMPPD